MKKGLWLYLGLFALGLFASGSPVVLLPW